MNAIINIPPEASFLHIPMPRRLELLQRLFEIYLAPRMTYRASTPSLTPCPPLSAKAVMQGANGVLHSHGKPIAELTQP